MTPILYRACIDQEPYQIKQRDQLVRREATAVGKQSVGQGNRKFFKAVELFLQAAHAIDDGIAELAHITNRAPDRRGEAFQRILLVDDTRVEVVLAAWGNARLPEPVSEHSAHDRLQFGWNVFPAARIRGRMSMPIDKSAGHPSYRQADQLT